MKFVIRISLFFVFVIFGACLSNAQDKALTKEYKALAIQRLSDLMNDKYVFPEVAKKTELHLKKQQEQGHFDQFEDDESFAEALTVSVQSINKDKHMKIWKNRPYEAPDNTPERMIEERLDQMNRRRTWNFGFNKVEVMEGNVGYLDLRNFAGVNQAKGVADAYMKLMSNCDAVIVDMSKNGGGDPEMVQYLCSFFFDSKVHLNSLYFREGDRTIDFWTLEEVGGEKMPDVPLFVITSEKTFSGAEEFSYNMQTQKRATLIGQTTGGGANPGGSMGINENLTVFIPGGKAINPITKTNWEGVGVIPEINVSNEEALDKTYALAKEAAESFRADRKIKYTSSYMELYGVLEDFEKSKSDEMVLKGLNNCLDEGIINEEDINMLGYDYLMGKQKPTTAVSIFKANTVLHPNSANVYDSYAESLMMQGDIKASVKNYQKAVDVASKNESGDLEFYKENLEKAKQKLKP